jgi:hypothetical protein
MFVPDAGAMKAGSRPRSLRKKIKQSYVEAFGSPKLITIEELDNFDETSFLGPAATDFHVPPPIYECDTEPIDDQEAKANPDALWVGWNGDIPLWKKGTVVNFGAYATGYPTRNHALYAAKMLWKAAMKWNAADIGMRFQWVNRLEDCAFVLRYTRRSGGTIARAFFPNTNDVNVMRVYALAFTDKYVRYLDAVFEHEVGHVIGLRHEFADEEGAGAVLFGPRNPDSVMSYNFPMRIQETDVTWVRNLYDYKETHIGGVEVKRHEPDN